MMDNLNRRAFVKRALLCSGASMLPFPLWSQSTSESKEADSFCVALCNHWSYTGIGWQLGIESCVLSAIDAMGMADLAPHVKTCIEWDALAYEFMADKFPEIAAKLKTYLASGKIELIGGTYGQPLGTMFSGESNIRQIVYGRNTILKALDYEMVTFLDEEEFSHPQIPQIALGAGYRYASLSQVDTWGKAGVPHLEVNSFEWQGMDGSKILSTPKNGLFGYSPDIKSLASSKDFQALRALGKPLIFTWEEFGWDHPEKPAYLQTSQKYEKVAEESKVEFVTLKEYLDKYGSGGRKAVYFNMDAWSKLLTWGLGGDQLRVMDRKVEAALLAAERFDAVAFSLGGANHSATLETAWKHLLTSQSHDVALCEYSRWQGDRMAPLDRIEDLHNVTWGSIGYGHLDQSNRGANEVLDLSLRNIALHANSQREKQGQLAVTVFNPCAWERTEIAESGRIYPVPENIRDIAVKHHSGRAVLSQIVKSYKDDRGNLMEAEVRFLAEEIPSLGYDTYYLEFLPESPQNPASDLVVDAAQFTMENRNLKVRLDSDHGAIVSLLDKRTNREMLRPGSGAFPIFRGTPNQSYCLFGAVPGAAWDRQENIPKAFDSSESKTTSTWTRKGPLVATCVTRHEWPLLTFETQISLYAGMPWVEVISRVLAQIPPAADVYDPKDHFPVDIKEGYWLTFAPAFTPNSIVRDFPLGIEATEHRIFQGRTFVDLVGNHGGLLVLHPGTQYFKFDDAGVFSNLVMREWESFYSHEYGWPRYSEYRHLLQPHDAEFDNAGRARAAEGFSQSLYTVVDRPREGDLPAKKSFLQISPENAHLLAFRKKEGAGYELRLLEIAGKSTRASIQMGIPGASAAETDLLGRKLGDLPSSAGRLEPALQPWKVNTLDIQ